MAYKKYIRRNGKLYGPYLYESKRVDGKVVSEYRGSEEVSKIPKIKPHHYKKIFFILLAIFFVGVLIQFIFVFPNMNKLSGKAVFEVDGSYKSGKPIDGIIRLSLSEGEFLPASSKIVFENLGNTYEFPINQVIKESSSAGDYYLNGKEIVGQGEGYGLEGERIIYPELNFILQVYKETSEEEVIVEENVSEEVEEEVVESDGSLDEIVGEASPITGDSIRESRGILSSLFGITGMVSMEFQNEINGKVSKDKPFNYELQDGEKVELKHGSVYFGEEELNDGEIFIELKDNLVSVTTEYNFKENGYGEEYLGDKKKTFSLDLSELNLTLQEGEISIKLVYEGEEIVSIKTLIEEDEKISEEIEEIPEESQDEIPEEVQNQEDIVEEISENETVEEIIDSSIWDISDFLTEEEKKILLNEFGEIQLKNVKSELFKGRIIRVYEIGEYSVEYSYDSSLNEDILEVQMERDRIKFLKDIANSISIEESSSKTLEGFQENYTF